MCEIITHPKNPEGFKHDPSGYSVEFFNGSKIFTLNSKPDNIRGKRATLIVYDEAAFVDPELIIATKPFVTQRSGATYSDDTAKKKDTLRRQPPNQIIMASSQNDVDCMFYKEFRLAAKQMLAGDRTVFVADMPCDTALKMYIKGEEVPALLEQNVVDAALKANPEKARREYYNKPDFSGGDNQVIKWTTMRNNERQIIPTMECTGNKIILGFDPARTMDNSIMTAMEIIEDPHLGICGNIISCTNFIDLASRKKYKLDSKRQVEEIRNIILGYNGNNPDYEFIDSIQLDSGSGGGAYSGFADSLLENFNDSKGIRHQGVIDLTSDVYCSYKSRYPNAIDKLRLVNPRKYRTQMVEEFIELMELGVIFFPYAYSGQEFLKLITGTKKVKDPETGESVEEEIIETYNLSQDEIINFNQIDMMKTEICSLYRYTNPENTNATYALAKEKQNKLHDDRLYSCLLCAHRLYELRRGKMIRKRRAKKDISEYIQFRAPKIF